VRNSPAAVGCAMTLNHAWMLKGWLLGELVPPQIMDAAEKVIESLTAREQVEPVHIVLADKDALVEDEQSDPPQREEVEPLPEVPPEAKQKKRRNWSPEAREAQAQRMRDRIAAGKMAKKATPARSETVEPEFTEAELRITVPKAPPRKSSLTDTDWPDIKEMLDAGRTRTSIASDYDEEPEDLDFFIASCKRREQRSGEALAPSMGGA
jgi:hypothetical protein